MLFPRIVVEASSHFLSVQAVGAAFALCLALFLLQVILKAYKKGLRHIPGPLAARFTGLWRVHFVWDGKAHEKYRELHAKYGPIVRTAPNVVDISDPSVITTIYGIGSKYMKSPFYNVFSVMYEDRPMHSLFSTQDPEYHKALKRPVAQKFSMSSIRALEPLVDPCNRLFCEAMHDLAGKPVDLGAWLQWYAFDVIGAITFRRRFGFMEQRRDIEHMIEGLDFGQFYGGVVSQIPSLHQLLLGNRFLLKLRRKLAPTAPDPPATAAKVVLQCLQEYDERSAEDAGQRTDFLAYLRQSEKGGTPRISTRDMMNHLMNNLLAGSDTTAISLRATFYYVIRDRRVYKKLQKEIDDAYAGGRLSEVVTFVESLNLPYLQYCIKEALRIHPGVSYPLERIVPQEGAMFCGKWVPGGTIVGVNAAVIHHDKSIFGSDADEFRPERWIQSDSAVDVANMDRHLMTFGYGARTCIGKNISIMEMGKVIPQIMRCFDLEWASKEPTWEVRTWFFAKQTGMMVKFTPRL